MQKPYMVTTLDLPLICAVMYVGLKGNCYSTIQDVHIQRYAYIQRCTQYRDIQMCMSHTQRHMKEIVTLYTVRNMHTHIHIQRQRGIHTQTHVSRATRITAKR